MRFCSLFNGTRLAAFNTRRQPRRESNHQENDSAGQVCPEATELSADVQFSYEISRVFRKMKPTRRLGCVELSAHERAARSQFKRLFLLLLVLVRPSEDVCVPRWRLG